MCRVGPLTVPTTHQSVLSHPPFIVPSLSDDARRKRTSTHLARGPSRSARVPGSGPSHSAHFQLISAMLSNDPQKIPISSQGFLTVPIDQPLPGLSRQQELQLSVPAVPPAGHVTKVGNGSEAAFALAYKLDQSSVR